LMELDVIVLDILSSNPMLIPSRQVGAIAEGLGYGRPQEARHATDRTVTLRRLG